MKTITSLTPTQKSHPNILHAQKIHTSLVKSNYIQFFESYQDSVDMNVYLIDMFVERVRVNAMKAFCRGYRPSICLGFLLRRLGFVGGCWESLDTITFKNKTNMNDLMNMNGDAMNVNGNEANGIDNNLILGTNTNPAQDLTGLFNGEIEQDIRITDVKKWKRGRKTGIKWLNEHGCVWSGKAREGFVDTKLSFVVFSSVGNDTVDIKGQL